MSGAGSDHPGWRFAIDRGGTFTDIVAFPPDGGIVTAKLLSASPAYPDAAAEGIRRLARGAAVAGVRMGTTVATNALLERRGEAVLLAITARLRRRAADRPSGAAPAVRPPHRPARAALRAASSRSTSASPPRAPS